MHRYAGAGHSERPRFRRRILHQGDKPLPVERLDERRVDRYHLWPGRRYRLSDLRGHCESSGNAAER
jgi:hypothetical protein